MFKLILRLVVISTAAITIMVMMGMKTVDRDQMEAWLNDFSDDSTERALAVNEGDLEFLKSAPQKRPHLLENKFTISHQSLKDGWIKMVQCHQNLDSVSIAQVLYHPRRTRNIEVLSTSGIDRAWVEKNSVQLENIGHQAKLCVKAEVRSLYSNYDGSYSMHNGPFLRKFLDGYYPMRVTMDVDLPSELRYEATYPQVQEGFEVTHNKDGMHVDALFVGELSVEVMFNEVGPQVN